jgi:predicted DNA-binding protein (UPF0251 family)
MVCCLPGYDHFGPMGPGESHPKPVVMTVDEYETVRLIDLEGFTQEECATQMKIARTTVQGIYNDARKKIADSLVNGKTLRIEGGSYRLCDGHENFCGCLRCKMHIRKDEPPSDR